MHGQPVSVARLIRFHFPAEWAGPEVQELTYTEFNISNLRVGQFVAVQLHTAAVPRVYIGRVTTIFSGQDQVEVILMRVPPEARSGPWQARRWSVWTDDGVTPKKEVISAAELVCVVDLVNGALTQDSLERLQLCGVPAGVQPWRDSTLPAASRRIISRAVTAAHTPASW